MSRTLKRLIIITIYLSLVGSIGFVIIRALLPEPSCFDGKRNQNETGIDCGGSCGACPEQIIAEEIVIADTTMLFGGPGTYDIVATVTNPNSLYGAAEFHYTFALLDTNGTIITETKGTDFILPTQERYLMAFNLTPENTPTDARLTIDHVKWISFADFDAPTFAITSKDFGSLSDNINYARAFGIVKNNSPYDFVEAVAYVIIRDERGTPIAVNRTTINNFDASFEREFRLDWPARFPGTITSADFEVYANVFDSQNFIKKYLPRGGFEAVPIDQ